MSISTVMCTPSSFIWPKNTAQFILKGISMASHFLVRKGRPEVFVGLLVQCVSNMCACILQEKFKGQTTLVHFTKYFPIFSFTLFFHFLFSLLKTLHHHRLILYFDINFVNQVGLIPLLLLFVVHPMFWRIPLVLLSLSCFIYLWICCSQHFPTFLFLCILCVFWPLICWGWYSLKMLCSFPC